jgi:hypothetical protein
MDGITFTELKELLTKFEGSELEGRGEIIGSKAKIKSAAAFVYRADSRASSLR